jgi:GxxExxY protein
VYNALGYGFLEAVYQNALMVTLRKRGHAVEVRQPVEVRFEGVIVGNYFADLIVNRQVIIELKSVETLCDAHEAQLLNYLRATDIEVGLLFNFGPKPQVKRKVFPNARKGNPQVPGPSPS